MRAALILAAVAFLAACEPAGRYVVTPGADNMPPIMTDTRTGQTWMLMPQAGGHLGWQKLDDPPTP